MSYCPVKSALVVAPAAAIASRPACPPAEMSPLAIIDCCSAAIKALAYSSLRSVRPEATAAPSASRPCLIVYPFPTNTLVEARAANFECAIAAFAALYFRVLSVPRLLRIIRRMIGALSKGRIPRAADVPRRREMLLIMMVP